MSELTRREAIKVAAGASLASAVGGSTLAETDHKESGGDQSGKATEIQGYFTASHGVTIEYGGGLTMVSDKSPYALKVKATLKDDRIEYVEPTTKAKVSFPADGFQYFAICYSRAGVYMNVFYDDKKVKNYAKWCCVSCPDSNMTVCGPGVCITCGTMTICC
jgi:hypothetical protein